MTSAQHRATGWFVYISFIGMLTLYYGQTTFSIQRYSNLFSQDCINTFSVKVTVLRY